MRIFQILRKKNAQTAVEYMLLLTTVVAIVLIGFKYYVPEFTKAANIYSDRVTRGIAGEPSRCGDGCCGQFDPVFGGCNGLFSGASFEDCYNCPTDCGECP